MSISNAQKNATEKFKKKTYKRLALVIRFDSGIPAALDDMSTCEGRMATAYTIEALREKLIHDGYLQKSYDDK